MSYKKVELTDLVNGHKLVEIKGYPLGIHSFKEPHPFIDLPEIYLGFLTNTLESGKKLLPFKLKPESYISAQYAISALKAAQELKEPVYIRGELKKKSLLFRNSSNKSA